MMRERLQLQGIVLILFGMLLALVGFALEMIFGSGANLIVLIVEIVALLMGIIGVAVSLSKENTKK